MFEKNYLKITDLSSYKLSFELSNYVWDLVKSWEYLAKDTVGKQLIRAIDSISANIAEGFGRYFKKDKIKFYYYSFGSLQETIDWIEKARVRKLITEDQYQHVSSELKKLPKEINSLIKYTRIKLAK